MKPSTLKIIDSIFAIINGIFNLLVASATGYVAIYIVSIPGLKVNLMNIIGILMLEIITFILIRLGILNIIYAIINLIKR